MTIERADFDHIVRFGREPFFLITNSIPRSRNGVFLQAR
jgi:hypothetical protein